MTGEPASSGVGLRPARLAALEADYYSSIPTSAREDHVFRRIQLSSAVFTVFVSVVFTRSSEDTAQYRLLALRMAYAARRLAALCAEGRDTPPPVAELEARVGAYLRAVDAASGGGG